MRYSITVQTCGKSKLLDFFSQCLYLLIILTLEYDIAMADVLLWLQGCNFTVQY